jgi:hypothetical protein
MFYIIRSLAFETHQFPDSLILNRFDVTVDLTRPKFAGGAGNVYKGEMRGRPIAVKEIKALEHEQYVSRALIHLCQYHNDERSTYTERRRCGHNCPIDTWLSC